MLRAHTSAHQVECLQRGRERFLIVGDVYRRDEIDRSHYPVFHQMEGVRLFSDHDLSTLVGTPALVPGTINDDRTPVRQERHSSSAAEYLGNDLKTTLNGLVRHLFGPVQTRWMDTSFPFTHPSWELEILFEGDWLEVLGCGVTEQAVVDKAGIRDKLGWAFGLGLERLAMVLFGVTDIRLFWSRDRRFLEQFACGAPTKFSPFSKYPPIYKDISFWVPSVFAPNEFVSKKILKIC